MTKENYQAVLEQLAIVNLQLVSLDAAVFDADPDATDIVLKLDAVDNNLIEVKQWAQQNIDKLNQEVVINSFLSEIKAVFEKYDAKLEVASGDAGYGLNYGEGESVGVKFTATTEGTTGNVVFNKSILTSEDFISGV